MLIHSSSRVPSQTAPSEVEYTSFFTVTLTLSVSAALAVSDNVNSADTITTASRSEVSFLIVFFIIITFPISIERHKKVPSSKGKHTKMIRQSVKHKCKIKVGCFSPLSEIAKPRVWGAI